MPDSDRLQQLRRQRELVAEQLAWLDREIAAVAGAPAPAPPAPPPPAPASPPVRPAVVAPPASSLAPAPAPARDVSLPADPTASADVLLEEYRVAPDTLKSDVKKGCLLYFFAALALFALGVVGLYFFFRHGK